jgi:hypothetical protein
MPIAAVQIRAEPYYRRAAIESGLKRLGYVIADERVSRLPGGPNDLLCLWNRKAGAEEQAAEAWERAGGVVLVFENGYLQRTDKTTYAISTHQHNGAGFFPVGDEDRFSKLGFELQGFRSGTHALVCGQRGIGSKLMASPPQWAEKMVAKLKARGQTAKLRSHPGNWTPKVPLLVDLAEAYECHVWSSGAGVRALVEGVAVTHHAPHWICEGWEADRVAALNHMAHGQWHHEEIATGEPFARMRDAGWGPRTWR